jgi:parallel beta-helix repeat protein
MATGMTYLAKRDLRRSGIKVTLRRALAATTCVAMSLIGGAAMSHAATAGTFYVDRTMSTCSDNGSGTVTAPFCTITKGVSKLTPGSTLYVGNGAYGESIKPTVSGTSSAGLLITAWPGRSPVIGAGVADGVYVSGRSYITISDLTFTGTTGDGIYVSNSDHITIAGNTVTFSGQPAKSQTAHGISLRASTASLVTGNTSDQNSDHGILLTSGTTSSTVSYNETSWNANGWQRNANGIDVISAGNTIIGNIAHDNEDSGLQFYPGGDNNLATLNVLYNNGDHGIDDFSVTGGRLIGNTVFHNCTTGINVEGTSGSYLVANNIAVDNAIYPAYRGISCSRRNGNIGIWDSSPSSTTVDHNLVWLTKPGAMYVFKSSYTSLSSMQAATGQERAGVQADPKFMSTSTGDFRLTEGSPAIDRADSGVPGEQSADILGNPRVRDLNVTNTFAAGPRQYDDLGAYEFQPITSPPPAQPPTAALGATPTGGQAPTVVTANASASTDPQGQTLSYAYDFGDGTAIAAQPGATATHTYQSAGTFTVTVTVTNTSGLTSTAQATITITSPPPAQPPTAALSATPTGGQAPTVVTANASASTDPQGQTLSYAYDFGDGTAIAAQPGATATHTYQSAGTFTVTVTVTNTSGLTSTAHATITITSPPPPINPAYVGQIATNYSTSAKTSAYITVWRSAGVQAGDLVVLTLQLSGTASTGPVTATDDRGSTYTVASSVANATGGRLVVLSGIALQPLAVGARLTAAFPTATGDRIIGDEFAGVSHVDTTAAASGTATAFSSGVTATTSTARELVFGSVAMFGGSANPIWATGWKDMTTYVVAPNDLGRAYQLPTATGGFAATGSASGSWLAVTMAFAP